ncbi:MAG: 1-phosphofructokinase [Ignavibacteriales bacterium]|nr:1-phosphofructokinase [Ignavibacteriales bacterium]
MILTVTINPLLERRLFFTKVSLGKSHRATKEFFSAGGKGINVSRQLNFLNTKNHALTFLGGNNGKLLRKCFVEDKIDFTIVSTKAETRIADLIIEEEGKRITTFFGTNSEISIDEVDEFKTKLDKMIQNCSCVVFSGSSPCKEADDIFSFGINLANEYDKISILDTYGNHLENSFSAAPTIIHNNVSEIESSLKIDLSTEQSKIDFLHQLNKKGIKWAFLTDGEKPIYASKYDFIYKVEFPKINIIDSTGSGDAFTAGIVYGIDNSFVFEETLILATKLGILNATMLETCKVDQAAIDKFESPINVIPIGKKMKLINDSPTI